MIKRWAHCRVGIAGALPIIIRFGSNPRAGGLTCPKCFTPGHFALHADGCRRCHKPEKIEKISYAGLVMPRTEPHEQSKETRALLRRCKELMKAHNIRYQSAFASRIGMDSNRFNAWWNGAYGEVGQARMNTRIESGIKRWLDQGLQELRDGIEHRNETSLHCIGHDAEEDDQDLSAYSFEDAEPVGNCWL